MEARLVQPAGADLLVVNAARVSFGKEKTVFDERDAGLIRYLARHEHKSPFFHPNFTVEFLADDFKRILPALIQEPYILAGMNIESYYDHAFCDAIYRVKGSLYAWTDFLTLFDCAALHSFLRTQAPVAFSALWGTMEDPYYTEKEYISVYDMYPSTGVYTVHIKAPIFVVRQLMRHNVGFAWNEISGRYVTLDSAAYMPDVWRGQAKDKKQGSSNESVNPLSDYEGILEGVRDWYTENSHICNEQRRMILPLSTYTELYATASTSNWQRMFNMRITDDTQQETRITVQKIKDVIDAVSEPSN